MLEENFGKAVVTEENGKFKISFDHDIESSDLIESLKLIYGYEENNPEQCEKIWLNLRGLPVNTLAKAIKFSIGYEQVEDQLMILNIINLVKIYNSLDDSYFNSETTYITDSVDLVDLKLQIGPELKQLRKQISIYFLSLLMTYNKTAYVSTDTIIELPKMYKVIFLSLDLLSLSGIFSLSDKFNTSECTYVKDAIIYLEVLLHKNSVNYDFLNLFNGNDFHDN